MLSPPELAPLAHLIDHHVQLIQLGTHGFAERHHVQPEDPALLNRLGAIHSARQHAHCPRHLRQQLGLLRGIPARVLWIGREPLAPPTFGLLPARILDRLNHRTKFVPQPGKPTHIRKRAHVARLHLLQDGRISTPGPVQDHFRTPAGRVTEQRHMKLGILWRLRGVGSAGRCPSHARDERQQFGLEGLPFIAWHPHTILLDGKTLPLLSRRLLQPREVNSPVLPPRKPVERLPDAHGGIVLIKPGVADFRTDCQGALATCVVVAPQ